MPGFGIPRRSATVDRTRRAAAPPRARGRTGRRGDPLPDARLVRGRGGVRATRRDTAIRDAVVRNLRRDPRFDAQDVEVVVAEGVVSLRGVVTTPGGVRMAEDAADGVEGVEEVRNELLVLSL